MSLSAPFIRRPVGTTLLTVALTLAGSLSYFFLPVSPLPQVEFPRFRSRPHCPARIPRRWPRPLRRLWNDNSGASRALPR